ncbi:glutamine amidotransferase of anthranilate synthase or aminodeoxychorismate synthase [Idiomarina sp. A28L]|uniref:anthranilate synthase component II n=1 Tax=Idiomarina sp. A28L TaxID=1036674 RepID=UPI0002138B1D|nr:aminodeoxychorismate/anthranilate synthase component II [Idiomarina sp. A28L]EGN75352.1 glutamine amidotransferase of anthranilate synthase or aminodeoxychorismate synthase [Idiomarina sp. A28L]
MLLMLDNYDSFTHNLVRYFEELGQEVQVVRNDALSVADIRALQPAALIISPGPCTPSEAGICLEAIKQLAGELPILGVCLGHQAIGQVFGAEVVRANEVMHGKLSKVQHNGSKLFAGMPECFNVVRYHSLVLRESSMPECLEVTARVADQGMSPEIMALQHRELPIYGVQFHPESVLSEYGHQVLVNFCKLLPGLSPEKLLALETGQREPLPQQI